MSNANTDLDKAFADIRECHEKLLKEAVKAERDRIRQKLQHSGGVMDVLWITEEDWKELSGEG